MTLPVLIAGGGIAGVAAALSLARRGHHVEVFERRERFLELGSGIQLAPNALRSLDRLGVLDAVLSNANHVDAVMLLDGCSGAPMARMPLGPAFRARFGYPYVVVRRCDLHRSLLDACARMPHVHLRTNCCVTGYSQERNRVNALFTDGKRIPGVALIGADGLHSSIRRHLVNDGLPRLLGHTTYSAVLPSSTTPPDLRHNSVVIWAGPGFHFVQYPIAGGEVFNLLGTCDNAIAAPLVGEPVSALEVARQFADMDRVPQTLIHLAPQWRMRTPYDRAPVSRWCDGAVVLIGDAAHPMVQYSAQGACMALEDAAVLGDMAIGRWSDVFAEFARRRMPRTGRVQQVARFMGSNIYHPGGAEAVTRNAMLAALSPAQMYDQVAWLYGAHDEGQ